MELVKLNQLNQPKIRQKIINQLKNGGLIIYPTDTSYGLGALPTNKQGIDKLLELKHQRQKPISLLLSRKLIPDFINTNLYARFLLNYFLPGKYTIISQLKENKKETLDRRILTPDGSLGWRFINLSPINQLIDQLDQPLTATSANLPNQPPLFSSNNLERLFPNQLLKKIDIFIDGGRLQPHPPSLIIDTFKKPGRILRPNAEVISPIIIKSFRDINLNNLNQATSFLSSILEANDKPHLILLFGCLGAGKTTFIKRWLKEEKNYNKKVTSPSFSLINEYILNQEKVIHIDLWRLSQTEIEKLYLTNYYQPKTTIFIEWAEKFLPFLNKTPWTKSNPIAIYLEIDPSQKRHLGVFRLF